MRSIIDERRCLARFSIACTSCNSSRGPYPLVLSSRAERSGVEGSRRPDTVAVGRGQSLRSLDSAPLGMTGQEGTVLGCKSHPSGLHQIAGMSLRPISRHGAEECVPMFHYGLPVSRSGGNVVVDSPTGREEYRWWSGDAVVGDLLGRSVAAAGNGCGIAIGSMSIRSGEGNSGWQGSSPVS